MKLTELNPRWVGDAADYDGVLSSVYYGISFDCPHCRVQRLGVMFHPPIDVNGGLAKDVQKSWQRTGSAFDNLTLTPSINTKVDVAGHWHGYIVNGEVT
jgi:hypothetical protein